MKRRPLLATVFVCLVCVSRVDAESARVCVATVDSQSQEKVLTQQVEGSATALTVHLDASAECTALLLPLAQSGSRLANGWRPQVVELAAWTEKVLPAAPVKWEWQKNNDPFEVWVFFFGTDAPALAEIRKLVSAMQQPNASEQLLAQQTGKLCDKLASRMSGKAKLGQGPKADPTLIGGTSRQADFPWRDYATKVGLNDALEGELVFRHGR